MKNAFNGLISGLLLADMVEERIFKLDISVETSKTEKQRTKTDKKRTEYPETVG